MHGGMEKDLIKEKILDVVKNDWEIFSLLFLGFDFDVVEWLLL